MIPEDPEIILISDQKNLWERILQKIEITIVHT